MSKIDRKTFSRIDMVKLKYMKPLFVDPCPAGASPSVSWWYLVLADVLALRSYKSDAKRKKNNASTAWRRLRHPWKPWNGECGRWPGSAYMAAVVEKNIWILSCQAQYPFILSSKRSEAHVDCFCSTSELIPVELLIYNSNMGISIRLRLSLIYTQQTGFHSQD